jgi:hypothetical protein
VRRLRRIFRVLLTAATVLSAALCVLVAASWIRTCFVAEHWHFDLGASGISYQIGLHEGGLVFDKSRWKSVARWGHAGWRHVAVVRDQFPEDYWRYFRAWGWFEFKLGDGGWDHYFAHILIPFWFMFLCTALLPAARLRAWVKRRRRRAAGQCPACGYDLRATPDRCPECGRKANRPS